LAISSTGVLQQVFCMCFDWLELQCAGRFCLGDCSSVTCSSGTGFFDGISGLIFGHLFSVIGSLFFQCVLFDSNVWPCMVFSWEHVPVTIYFSFIGLGVCSLFGLTSLYKFSCFCWVTSLVTLIYNTYLYFDQKKKRLMNLTICK